jgi:preprotein translocase subunit SecA
MTDPLLRRYLSHQSRLVGAVEKRWPRGLAALPWPFSVAVSFLGGRADRWLVTDSQRTAERFLRRQRAELADLDSIETGQRESVYATRRRALNGEDLSHTVDAALDRAVTTLIARNREPRSLCEALATLYPTRLTPEALTKIGDFPPPGSSLAERVRADLHAAYVQREIEIGTDNLRAMEQRVLRAVLDLHWRRHLANLDLAYQDVMSRQPPLAGTVRAEEYRRAAERLHVNMTASIDQDLVGYLFHLKIAETN